MNFSLLTVEVRLEHDVVLARRRAIQIARLLQFETADQIRIATAVSELARNVYQYAGAGKVTFGLSPRPRGALTVTVSDTGPGIAALDAVLNGKFTSATGLGLGMRGARGLVDIFIVKSSPDAGTHIEIAKHLPVRAPSVSIEMVGDISRALTSDAPHSAFEEMQGQNQQLIAALDQVERQREELQAMNAALEAAARHADAANRAKTDFLANISHEIRTPMSAISGLSSLLARTELSDKQRRFVTTLRDSAHTLSVLVNDLLDLSKIEEGKIVFETIPFSLTETVDKVVEMSRAMMTEDDVTLQTKYAPTLGSRHAGDPQRLQQILLNLVSNAIKFTNKGSVTVTITEDDLGPDRVLVRICVSDTGIGIADDKLDQIFEKFVQADASTTRRFGGTGLGLAIARSLTELMGGTMAVKSRVGEGSSFTVSLPLDVISESSSANPVVTPVHGRQVLVVDDHMSARMIASSILSDRGHDVACASNGMEAISMCEARSFDLVLMDIQMEGIDGFETVRRLRRLEQTASRLPMPIFALSTQRSAEDDTTGRDAGMTGYFLKPLTPEKLEAIWSAVEASVSQKH